jgi:hypothetical protein
VAEHSPIPWDVCDHGEGAALCDAKGRRVLSMAYACRAVSAKIDSSEALANLGFVRGAVNEHAKLEREAKAGRLALAAVESFLNCWGEQFENAEHSVNGGDLVEWVGGWLPQAFAAQAAGKAVKK